MWITIIGTIRNIITNFITNDGLKIGAALSSRNKDIDVRAGEEVRGEFNNSNRNIIIIIRNFIRNDELRTGAVSSRNKDIMVFKRKQNTYKKLNNLHIVGLSSWINNCSMSSTLLKEKKHINLPNPIDTNTTKVLSKTDKNGSNSSDNNSVKDSINNNNNNNNSSSSSNNNNTNNNKITFDDSYDSDSSFGSLDIPMISDDESPRF